MSATMFLYTIIDVLYMIAVCFYGKYADYCIL